MDHSTLIKTISGHLGRLAVPVVLWLGARFGLQMLDTEAVAIADAIAVLVGVVLSTVWSVKSRKAIQNNTPKE